ncbi:MAG: hypothetical protein HYV41_03245 [Candidatus Magasanikbacteria bacterium]|nr:hypothetical protein [Candidatus Magasanikbacteria bacterium]
MSETLKKAIADNKIVLRLDRSSHVIAQLTKEGRYHGVDRDITDNNFPTERQGVETVMFCIVSGKLFKRADGIVYRADVEAAFGEVGVRLCDPDEALLPPAKDHNLGLNDAPYVAFIRGSRSSFFISGGPTRGLKQYADDDRCGPHCVLVGVCEK